MNDGDGRRLRILAQLTEGDGSSSTKRLCEVSAGVTGMSGAGIMLMSGDVPHGAVCSTDEVSALIEELQYSLGEGPCVDAYAQDRPVLEPDLREPVTPRWPAFSGPALDAGVGAVFGFPLNVGAARFGVLDLYRVQPGTLTDEQHADALVMAGVAARAVLLMQANAPPGQLAADLEVGADFQYVVHQASGMVAAQLDTTVGNALVRLRAYAFGNEQPLIDVARAVVNRQLRFSDQTDEESSS